MLIRTVTVIYPTGIMNHPLINLKSAPSYPSKAAAEPYTSSPNEASVQPKFSTCRFKLYSKSWRRRKNLKGTFHLRSSIPTYINQTTAKMSKSLWTCRIIFIKEMSVKTTSSL